jgi:hypothetical protein
MFVIRIFMCLLLVPLFGMAGDGVVFDEWFEDRTLRMDFVFSGDSLLQTLSLDEVSSERGWAGRRRHLDTLCLEGYGQIYMRDALTGRLLYAHSFSTLFQEWQHTAEARHRVRAFESSFLLPMPKRPVEVTVELRNSHRRVTGRLVTPVDPHDILIRRLDAVKAAPHRYLQRCGGTDECIDIAIVAEGYTKGQRKLFLRDARRFADALFAHEPFASLRGRFNIVAVAPASADAGTSVPHDGLWKETTLGSHFDTFYSERYLTTLHLKRLQDVLTGIPYEHVVVLVNSDVYGGGGIYNLYMLSSAHHKYSLPVMVHEFGHSFAGLGDEYAYGDDEPYFHEGVEPWEQNLTTLADFGSKWADMVPQGVAVPTPAPEGKDKDTESVGVYEGGGYLSKGVYRPAPDCRMKVNDVPQFCPVCRRAIERVVRFYTE